MSNNGEDIIRETVKKLGAAIGVQMQIPDAMIANLGAVLQAQIDLLAELQSTGRLIPAGGMALTAEEGYLAGKVMAALCTRNGYFGEPLGLVDALKFLESALFPATEPAEERCRKWTVRVAGGIETGIQCVLPDGHECFHDYVPPIHNYVQPAPAEPAEEETKAVTFDEIAQSLKRIGDAESSFGFNLRFWRRIAEKLIAKYPHLASSPVVPAPTETGPWQRIEDVPETVGRLTDRDGDIWEWDGDNWVTPETAILPTAYINRKYAPFVAAEEGK